MKIIEQQAIIAQRIMQDHATQEQRDICAYALRVLGNSRNTSGICSRFNLMAIIIYGVVVYHTKSARVELKHTFGAEKMALIESVVNHDNPKSRLVANAKAALLLGKASFLIAHNGSSDDIEHLKQQVFSITSLSVPMKHEAKKVLGM